MATVPQGTATPATMPTATVPQATGPPATVPPATVPPATVPPATVPQPTVPQPTGPPATVPQPTRPPATVPQATAPPTTYNNEVSLRIGKSTHPSVPFMLDYNIGCHGQKKVHEKFTHLEGIIEPALLNALSNHPLLGILFNIVVLDGHREELPDLEGCYCHIIHSDIFEDGKEVKKTIGIIIPQTMRGSYIMASKAWNMHVKCNIDNLPADSSAGASASSSATALPSSSTSSSAGASVEKSSKGKKRQGSSLEEEESAKRVKSDEVCINTDWVEMEIKEDPKKNIIKIWANTSPSTLLKYLILVTCFVFNKDIVYDNEVIQFYFSDITSLLFILNYEFTRVKHLKRIILYIVEALLKSHKKYSGYPGIMKKLSNDQLIEIMKVGSHLDSVNPQIFRTFTRGIILFYSASLKLFPSSLCLIFESEYISRRYKNLIQKYIELINSKRDEKLLSTVRESNTSTKTQIIAMLCQIRMAQYRREEIRKMVNKLFDDLDKKLKQAIESYAI